jgi:hypothetical protein
MPARAGSFRSFSAAASSADTKRMETVRSSQTTRFASRSAASIASELASLARSMVDASALM